MSKVEKHFINIMVPISHRMEDNKILSNGKPNKYFLAKRIASKHHRGSVSGGGYALFANDYEINVRMPTKKLAAFRADLKANGIRSKNWGIVED